MTYRLNFTDEVNKGFIEVEDNTVNNETSLELPGRTKSDYGELVLTNLLHLLENFANNNPPNAPIEGQLWYDTTLGVDQLKIYDGAQWVSASSIKKASSQPIAAESNLGDIWVDTNSQQLYLYNGNGWTLVGPEFSQGSNTGAKFEEIIDTANVAQKVVINYVDTVPTIIISSVEFTPKARIGDPTNSDNFYNIIKPGINLMPGYKYWGVAERAESLIIPGEGSVLAPNFARRDKDNTFIRPIRVQNNLGISIGETPTTTIAVSGSNAIVSNLASGGDIRFRLSETGTSPNVLVLKSNQRVGINKVNPLEALDVSGNIKTNGKVFIDNILDDQSSLTTALTVNGNVDISANLSIDGNFTTNGSTIAAGNITPAEDLVYNLGTALTRYNNVFAQNFQGTSFTGNTFTGQFNGSLNGAATRLIADTTFAVTGDVTSASVVFGGPSQDSVGGTKTFTTTISPTFIFDKTEVITVEPTDEILVSRQIGPDRVLRKLNPALLFAMVPTIPIATITQFAGRTAPNGWLFCNGALLLRAEYEDLFDEIGHDFNRTLIGTPDELIRFALPDYRGRFALGNPNMGVNNDELGFASGSTTKVIELENLPDHSHTLIGDEGTSFYASTNIVNAPDSGVDGTAQPIAGTSSGSFIAQTGGVISDNLSVPMDVMNPYQTANFIIFTGRPV